MVQQNQNINQNQRGNVSFGYVPPSNLENNSGQNKSAWSSNNFTNFNAFKPSGSNSMMPSSSFNMPVQSQKSSFPEYQGNTGQTTNVSQGQKPLQFNFNPGPVNQSDPRSGSGGFNNGNKIAFQPFQSQNFGSSQDASNSASGQSRFAFKAPTPVI